MTLASEKKEIYESVRELDRLLEDLNNAQERDEKCHTKRLRDQNQFYNSTASLFVPGSNANRPQSVNRPSSSASNQERREALRNIASQSQIELDREREPLESTLPNGVFVKDVVEEEILVDHVLQHAKEQPSSDRKFSITSQQQHQSTSSAIRPSRIKQSVTFGPNRYNDNNDDLDDNCSDSVQYNQRTNNKLISDSNLSLNSGLTDLGSESNTSSVLDPNKIINCHVCNERVVGQVITALGRNYHKEHFTCAHCHQELGTRNFYEKDNLPYCERDYQQLFSPKCAACMEAILDKVTIALDQTFHPEHFVCAHCGCQFDQDDGFHEKDGRAYCKNDFFELFANKCASCHLPITANYITALNVQWHPDCFTCSDCHCPFGDGKFFDIDGLPYCEIHYHARCGSLCAACKTPIIGKCTTAMFRKFHPDHFTCTYCLKVLCKSFKEENDKPYCHDCFDKLYS